MRRLSLIACILVLAWTATAFGQSQSGQGAQGPDLPPGVPAVQPSIPGGPTVPAQQPPAAAVPQQQGQGGAAASAPLGQPAWVITGQVMGVSPDNIGLVVATDQGSQPLSITPGSVIRDEHNNPIKLSDVHKGDRVLVSFRHAPNDNQVVQLFKMPK